MTASGAADGKLTEGDILLSVSLDEDVVTIDRVFTLSDALLNVREGDIVAVTVERGGESVTLQFTAEAQYFTAVK